MIWLDSKDNGGDGEIRTLEWLSPLHAFQACSFDRSDTSPHLKLGAIVLTQAYRVRQLVLGFVITPTFFKELRQQFRALKMSHTTQNRKLMI